MEILTELSVPGRQQYQLFGQTHCDYVHEHSSGVFQLLKQLVAAYRMSFENLEKL